MKRRIVLAIVVAASMASAATVTEDLLDRIAWVESRNCDAATGDNGRAVGRFQIWATYLADANRFLGTSYTHEEMRDAAKAREVVRAYLSHYGRAYERRTGKVATDEVLARIHNGGPRGYEKAATLGYWKRVKEASHE